MVAFLPHQISHGDPVLAGFRCPENTSLPGKLLAVHLIILSLKAFAEGRPEGQALTIEFSLIF